MTQIIQNLIHRIGHRGAFLIFIGCLFVFYGSGLVADPVRGIPFTFIFDTNIWSWIFVSVGAVVLTGAPCLRNDRWHYTLAALMAAIWSSAWVSMWVIHDVPGAWALTAIWAAYSVITVCVSSWRENYRNRTSPLNHANETIAKSTGPQPRIKD